MILSFDAYDIKRWRVITTIFLCESNQRAGLPAYSFGIKSWNILIQFQARSSSNSTRFQYRRINKINNASIMNWFQLIIWAHILTFLMENLSKFYQICTLHRTIATNICCLQQSTSKSRKEMQPLISDPKMNNWNLQHSNWICNFFPGFQDNFAANNKYLS